MKILLLAVGKTTTPYINTGLEHYLKRVNHYIPVELKIIPDVKTTKAVGEDAQKLREGEAMTTVFSPGDFIVLLDERGKELTSREFSTYINRKMLQGIKRVVFVVGGPYGFSDEIYNRANDKLSLSRMTFTHEMVRLFFIEQIYRAMTIMRGEPYHHD